MLCMLSVLSHVVAVVLADPCSYDVVGRRSLHPIAVVVVMHCIAPLWVS